MAERQIDPKYVPDWLPESLTKFGARVIRPGDVLARLIVIAEERLRDGEKMFQTDILLVGEIERDNGLPFIYADDFDTAGGFSSSGIGAFAVDLEENTATIPVFEKFDGAVHFRKVIGHVESKEEYLQIRQELIGDVPAGYARVRGTPYEPSHEDVAPLKFKINL